MGIKTSGHGSADYNPFFKGRDHLSAFAVAIKAHSVREVENKEGKLQNFVDAEIVVFQTAEQLQAGEPATQGNYTLGGNALANSLVDECGSGDWNFGKLASVSTKSGNNAIVLQDISDPSVIDAAVKWLDSKESADSDDFAAAMGL